MLISIIVLTGEPKFEVLAFELLDWSTMREEDVETSGSFFHVVFWYNQDVETELVDENLDCFKRGQL